MGRHPRILGVRWLILALLSCFGLVSYVERINLTIAARYIREEFSLSDAQIGWSFSAFLISYTLAQIPAGLLTDRYGSRRVLTCAALAWFILTIALGLCAGILATTATQVIISLVTLRFLLGLAEAPTYPAAVGAIANWFPPQARGTPNAVIQFASYAGDALTVAVLAVVMTWWGWRHALFASAVPALALTVVWWSFARSRPEEHSRVEPEELAYIRGGQAEPSERAASPSLTEILKDRNVAILSAAYFCHGYVLYLFFFWFYIYLVDVRGFHLANGGFVAALPTISAAVLALGGGPLADWAAGALGPVRGRQMVIVGCGVAGAGLLCLGAFAQSPVLAVTGFVLAIGTRGLAESAYVSLLIDVSRGKAATACGVMNAMCNLGGAISTALAPALVPHVGWQGSFAVAALVTAASGLLTLGLSTRDLAVAQLRAHTDTSR